MRSISLALSVALFAFCISGAEVVRSAPVAAVSPYVVGPNVQVSSAFPGNTHDELLASADPSNPNDLIGCVIAYYPRRHSKVIAYSSFDGGMHWAPTLLSSEGNGTGDPACAFGTGGHAYFASLGSAKSALGKDTPQTFVYSSNDDGRTWPYRVILPSTDREYITVDNGKSKYAGRVYLNATKGTQTIDPGHGSPYDVIVNGITVYHSLDSAKSFAFGRTLTDLTDRYVLGMGDGAILSDGTFVALFGDLKQTETGWNYSANKPNAWLKVVASHDGGDHFDTASVVDDWYFCDVQQDSEIPTIAVDASTGPFRNRLYAAWPDNRTGRCQVMISHSDDKGKTWSPGLAVNDDYPRTSGSGPDDFMPVVAVNNRGVVGLMWYDRRDNPDNLGYWVRFSVSYDGGETFAPSTRVSESPSDLYHGTELGLEASSGGGGNPDDPKSGGNRISSDLALPWITGGHSAGLAVTADGLFHPMWVDNRTGTHQAWTASVAVSGQAYKNGSAQFAAYTDVTKHIYLDLRNPQFDRTTGTVTVEARLVNTSKKAISGPIDARVLVLRSDFGVPAVVNSDNGNTNFGAVWDFSSALDANSLAPGATSAPKQLVFHLTDIRPLHAPSANEPGGVTASFIHLEAQMLAR